MRYFIHLFLLFLAISSIAAPPKKTGKTVKKVPTPTTAVSTSEPSTSKVSDVRSKIYEDFAEHLKNSLGKVITPKVLATIANNLKSKFLSLTEKITIVRLPTATKFCMLTDATWGSGKPILSSTLNEADFLANNEKIKQGCENDETCLKYIMTLSELFDNCVLRIRVEKDSASLYAKFRDPTDPNKPYMLEPFAIKNIDDFINKELKASMSRFFKGQKLTDILADANKKIRTLLFAIPPAPDLQFCDAMEAKGVWFKNGMYELSKASKASEQLTAACKEDQKCKSYLQELDKIFQKCPHAAFLP